MPLQKAYGEGVKPWKRHAVSAAALIFAMGIGYAELKDDVADFGKLAQANHDDFEGFTEDVDERLDDIERKQDVLEEKFEGEARAQRIYREQTSRDLERILRRLETPSAPPGGTR